MKVELTLEQRATPIGDVMGLPTRTAVCIEISEELNDYLRMLLRYDEIRITGVTLVPSDTEPYIDSSI